MLVLFFKFVADYVKENLLSNIVQKIKNTDEDKVNSKKKEKRKDQLSNKLSYIKPQKSSVSLPNSEVSSKEGAEILMTEITLDNKSSNLITEESTDFTSQKLKSKFEETKIDTVNSTSNVESELISSGFSKIEEIDTENKVQLSPESSLTESAEKSELEDLQPVKSMKDDAYESVKQLKKNSLSAKDSRKEKERPKTSVFSTKQYMDSQSNINYAKLLTDQIIEIDEKVIDYCRNKADLSGMFSFFLF